MWEKQFLHKRTKHTHTQKDYELIIGAFGSIFERGCGKKKRRAYGECLGANRRRRTQQAAKSLGELQASEDPGVSEWGNLTQGTELTLSE